MAFSASNTKGDSNPIEASNESSEYMGRLANDEDYRFKRRKPADSSFNYEIKGKLSNGSRTQWKTQYDRSLEYLMFPSLQLLPKDVQEKDIVPKVPKQIRLGTGTPGSPNAGGARRATMNFGGSSPNGRNARSPSPLGKRASTANSTFSRRGSPNKSGGGGGGSPSPAPDDMRDDDSRASAAPEPEPELNYTRPEIFWDVSINAPDPQKQEDALAIKEREFQRRLNEVGEKYKRDQIVTWFKDDIRAAELEAAERKRDTFRLKSKMKENLQKEADNYIGGVRSPTGGRRGMAILSAAGDTLAQEEKSRASATARRASIAAGFGGVSFYKAPEYLYKTLKTSSKKKHGRGEVLNTWAGAMNPAAEGNEQEDDGIGGMIDEDVMYAVKKNKLATLLGKEAAEEHAFDLEGLLYYRFAHDEQMEIERKQREKEQDERAGYLLPGKGGGAFNSSGNSLNTRSATGVSRVDEEDQGPLMNEYSANMLKASYRGNTILKSDVSNINLSRLRRAVQQRLSGLSVNYMADQEEEEEADLDEKGPRQSIAKRNATAAASSPPGARAATAPAKATAAAAANSPSSPSPGKSGKKRNNGESGKQRDNDPARNAQHDKEKAAFLESMGLPDEVAHAAIGALSTAGLDPLVSGTSPSKKKILVMNPDGHPYGMEAGSINGMGGITTYSPEVNMSSRLAMQGVPGGTRIAQDALIEAQLEAGIVPQAFIRRSDNLDAIDIEINHFGIGDEQGFCLGLAIKGLKFLRKLNLEDNRLTKLSVPSIVNNVFVPSLTTLNLSSNMVHNEGAHAISALLCAPGCVLSGLILAKCGLLCSDLPLLLKGMKREETSVTDLDLSNNEIAAQGSRAISEVLSFNRCSLRQLDLSWNKLGTEGAVAIADSLAINSSLKCIKLSANGIADKGGQRVAVSLMENKHIEDINLSQNNIAGASCFVFSKTVAKHPCIKKLDLSFNPVGEAGARSIYREIMRGLRCFVIMRSCSYFAQEGMFNYTTPSLDSPYTLDMSEPYKAAVMAELIIMAKENPQSNRFGTIKFTHANTGGGASSKVEEEIVLYEKNGEIMCKGKVYHPPKAGTLLVNFFASVSRPTIHNAASEKSIAVTKLIITHAREQDRIDYLKLITADMYMTCAQSQSIIDSFVDHKIIGSGGIRKLDILACTWCHLLDTENMYDFMCRHVQPIERRLLINEVSIDEYKFNWTNPTGHWRLNLEDRKQLFVMMKIISINNSEADFSRNRSGRDDTSQNGNWFNFRNAKVITRKGAVDIVIDQAYVDNLPRSGIIDFDYVSTTRPGQDFLDAAAAAVAVAGSGGKTVSGAAHGAAGDAADADDDMDDVRPGTRDESRPGTRGGEGGGGGGGGGASGAKPQGKPNIMDKIEAISDEDFYVLMGRLGLSNRKRVSNQTSLFPLIELQLAVTKHWYTVQQVISVMDCFDQHNHHTQANVCVTMFSRIKDLWNMDTLLRSVEVKTQREILNRLGCLNVINPLKLALNYMIPLVHLDYRILLTTLLEISPQEGTEAIREDPKTDVSVLTFYGALHRIVAVSRPEVLRFTYLEFGVQFGAPVAWGMRRDALRKFLVGSKPVDKNIFRIVSMHSEMSKAGTLTRGPIEQQYASHLKISKNTRRVTSIQKTKESTVNALRAKVDAASEGTEAAPDKDSSAKVDAEGVVPELNDPA